MKLFLFTWIKYREENFLVLTVPCQKIEIIYNKNKQIYCPNLHGRSVEYHN